MRASPTQLSVKSGGYTCESAAASARSSASIGSARSAQPYIRKVNEYIVYYDEVISID